MERLVADSLAKHAANAANAPTNDNLLPAVHARLHRRRATLAISALVVAFVAIAITALHSTTHPQPTHEVPAPGPAQSPRPRPVSTDTAR
ncbi:hypothetical protein ACXJJ3_16905 [Kribbella sp. WER1]